LVHHQEYFICYSKEVSLIAGTTIFAGTTLNYIKYKINRLSDLRKKSVATYLLLAYLAIGAHQFLEFFAIYLNNTIIYKIGLLFSISGMFFNLRASEKFFAKNLGSSLFLGVLAMLSIHIFTRSMYFENAHFYVRGTNHFYWGAIWMIFFIYWNLIHLFYFIQNYGRFGASKIRNLPFASLNISFILSAIYCYIIGLSKNLGLLPACGSFEIVFDAPSIWCVFASIQGIFLYYFFKSYNKEEHEIIYTGPPRLKAMLIAIIITIIIFFTLPLFSTLSYKMILK